MRAWARRGETPVLQYHFNWNKLSVIAGITFWNFYFQFYPGSIGAEGPITFLKHLQRHIRGRLLIVWEKLPAHRRRAVRNCLAGLRGRITMEHLPSYAPELNPVEYIWGHCKQLSAIRRRSYNAKGTFLPEDSLAS